MNKFIPRSFSETLLLILRKEHPDLFRENGSLIETKAAKRFGIDQPTFRRWAKGGNPKSEYISILSQLFSISPSQMRGETAIPRIDNVEFAHEVNEPKPMYITGGSNVRHNRIPILSSAQAIQPGKYLSNPEIDWLELAQAGNNFFALKVTGRAMQNPYGSPTLPDGSFAIVDPDQKAKNGDIVIVKLQNSSDVVIKKIIFDGPSIYLEALNPDYKPILAEAECIIIGVVKKVLIDI